MMPKTRNTRTHQAKDIRALIFAEDKRGAEPVRSALAGAGIAFEVVSEPAALVKTLDGGPGILILDAGLSPEKLRAAVAEIQQSPRAAERPAVRLVPPAGASPEPILPLPEPLDSAIVIETTARDETIVSLVRGLHEAGERMAAALRSAEETRTANEQLAEVDRRRSELLAELAHELRNPLAPIQNAIQVLRLAGVRTPILDGHRDIIERQVARMSSLLDDLLEVSRIHRGLVNLTLHPVEVGEVLERAAESSRKTIDRRHHALTLTKPVRRLRVMGDTDRLVQAVANLMSYAARHTEEGGTVALEAAREDDRIALRVRAARAGLAWEGPAGVPGAAAAELVTDHPLEGLDLSLALARDLVMLHGGTIESRAGGAGDGVEFVIRLPHPADKETAPRGKAPATRPALSPEATAGRRILVVDDIVDTADSLAQLLQLLGNDARAAYSATEALRLVRDFKPDLVLLDIAMPGMDGYEAARRIRENPGSAGLKLVAMTGYGRDIDRLKAREAGFDWHATKPVKLEELKELLAK